MYIPVVFCHFCAHVLRNPLYSIPHQHVGAFHRGRKKAGEKSKPKSCVMCGLPNVGDGGCFIRRQNKGVCTECDCDYWIQISTGCLIKWCKGCKNFLAGAKFGKKVLK